MIRIRRCRSPLRPAELDAVRALHDRCMPGVALYDTDSAVWWLAMQSHLAVGYAAARNDTRHCALFLVAAGVHPSWRGDGLHGRLIRARLRGGRSLGARIAVTYTMLDNARSANALIHAGFRKSVAWCYVGNGVDYWERKL